MTELEDKLEGLTDHGLLNRIQRGESGIPEHQNCRSTMTLSYRMPTGKQIVYEIAQLAILLETTPWWRVLRRLELKSELLSKIITGLALGYIVKGKR